MYLLTHHFILFYTFVPFIIIIFSLVFTHVFTFLTSFHFVLVLFVPLYFFSFFYTYTWTLLHFYTSYTSYPLHFEDRKIGDVT